MAGEFPGGFGYQTPGLPPMAPFPTPFPADLGAFGPLAYMGLQQAGMLPQSLMNFSFTPTTDIWTQFQAIQQFQARTTAMQAATRGDVNTLIQYQRSIARATGADWGRLEGRAGRAAQWIGDMLPVLSMIMPEAIDTAMGPRGSQVVMASQLANAGRFMFDPSTGRMGLTGAEAGQMSDMMYQRLYGSDDATLRMRGIGAGRAGILMNEMLSRGLIGGDPFMSAGSLRAADLSNITGLVGNASGFGALGSLATMGTSRMDPNRINQMADQTRGMARIITAISDMFGANGQPNAPIPQILAALDKLGGGIEYQYSADKVENTFRQMQQATISGRISLPNMAQLVGQNSAMLASMGLNPRDAIQLSQQSVNFATAATGIFSGNFYGRMSPQEMAATNSQLQAAAMTSPAGQMAAIAAYLSEASSGLAADSEFSQLAAALKLGQTTFAGGKSVLSALQGGGLRDLYVAAGGNAANFNAAIMNPEVGRQYATSVSLAVRRLQGQEISSMSAGYLGGTMADVFDIQDAGARVQVGQNLMNRVFANGGKFAAMTDSQKAAELERMSAESAADVMGGKAADYMGRARGRGAGILADISGATMQFGGMELNRALQMFGAESAPGMDRLMLQNRVGAGISQALGDLGRFSFSQRLADELLNMNPGDGMAPVLSKLLGGVDKQKISNALAAAGRGGQLGNEMNSTLAKIKDGTATDADIAALRDNFSALRSGLKQQGVDIDKSIMATDAALGSVKGQLISGITGMPGMAGVSALMGLGANPLGSMLSRDANNPLRPENQMAITISGELTIKDDGKAKLESTGRSEGPGVGAKK